MKSVNVKQPAKIILYGEHFVVHGSYAVALTINKFLYITVYKNSSFGLTIQFRDGSSVSYDTDADVKIIKYLRFLSSKLGINDIYVELKLDFPISAGLGSSASMAVGLSEALYKLKYGYSPSSKVLYELADKFEKLVHGNPSGIDLNTILSKKIILYDGTSKRVIDAIHDIKKLKFIMVSYASYEEWPPLNESPQTGMSKNGGREIKERVYLEKLHCDNLCHSYLSTGGLLSFSSHRNIYDRDDTVDYLTFNLRVVEDVGLSAYKAGGWNPIYRFWNEYLWYFPWSHIFALSAAFANC